MNSSCFNYEQLKQEVALWVSLADKRQNIFHSNNQNNKLIPIIGMKWLQIAQKWMLQAKYPGLCYITACEHIVN